MSIKLVAIDIDGTLVNDQKKISPFVKEAIMEARTQGVKIVLCTGRPTIGVYPYLKELDLIGSEEYVIAYNGALVQTTDGEKTLVSYTLDHENYLEIEALSRTVGSHLHTLDHEHLYTANRDISEFTVFESFLTKMPLFYRPVSEMSENLSIIKMMMIDKPEILDTAISQLPGWFFEKYATAKSEPFYFEIVNKNASKGNALASLAQTLDIKVDEVMALGDNENDLSMIQYAGTGVAMGNAVPSVKQAAKDITKTNEQDGVAFALKKYLKK